MSNVIPLTNHEYIYKCNCGENSSVFRFEKDRFGVHIVCQNCGLVNHKEDIGLHEIR